MPLDEIADIIITRRSSVGPSRSVLVGISGIDASGKGYVAAKLVSKLKEHLKIALINVDGWLNLPSDRFTLMNPGHHFYQNALRLDEMFSQLVLPLKCEGSVRTTVDFAAETDDRFSRRSYQFRDIDIVLVEGIFIFKKAYIEYFDVKIWIDCPFETALNRAIVRAQEGLQPEATVRAYKTIYFPAQDIHFELDDPRAAADIVFDNS